MFDATGAPVPTMPEAIKPAAAAVILDAQGALLLHKRSDNGFWGLPGGWMHVGESVEQCILREVYEETGLRVSVRRLVGVYSDPTEGSVSTYPDGTRIQYVCPIFECVAESGELQVSYESTELGYFQPDSLPVPILPPARLAIMDALENRAEPFIR